MEWILAIATIIGGISAVWFFWDKFIETRTKSKIQKNPIKIAIRVTPLDGFGKAKINGLENESLENGMKFYIAMHNVASQQLILSRFSCELTKTSYCYPKFKPRLDVSIMKFGSVNIPHRLFIKLSDFEENIWWLTQNSPNEKEKRHISSGIKNLLRLIEGSLLTIEVPPQKTEQIEGVLILNKMGVYLFRFSFKYETTQGTVIVRRTKPIAIHASEIN